MCNHPAVKWHEVAQAFGFVDYFIETKQNSLVVVSMVNKDLLSISSSPFTHIYTFFPRLYIVHDYIFVVVGIDR